MNTKDLMIGNWVYYTKKSKFPMRVVSLGEDYVYLDFEENEGDVFEPRLEDMMPIPVTEDLLQRIGFEKKRVHISYHIEEEYYMLHIHDMFCFAKKAHETGSMCWSLKVDDGFLKTKGIVDFMYLHEFQNGIRLITGKDLEVEL